MDDPEELNHASNGEIAEIYEWLEAIHPLSYRLTDCELQEVAAELAHRIYGTFNRKP